MARQRYDISSKWLLHNQAKGVLLLGGLKRVRRVEPGPGEIAPSRKYPDALLRVCFTGQRKPEHILVEVATWSEERALKQALDDLTLAYSALGHLPELLMLVLRPKGSFRIGGKHEVGSKRGLSRLGTEWKAVELWTLPAEPFLAEGDVGVVPWVPLMQFDGPPEGLLERCAEKIEREAHPDERANLLAVSQVLTELRFPNPELSRLFGGQQAMIESPLLLKMRAGVLHKGILAVLKARFGTIPGSITKQLQGILDEEKLTNLNVVAAQCPDLEAFRDALLA
jgi:hypothetical protein